MLTNIAVEHYVEARKQGMGHDKAAAHTRQRYGISQDYLSMLLTEARDAHVEALKYLPPTNLVSAISRVIEIRDQGVISEDSPCVGCGSSRGPHYCQALGSAWRAVKEQLNWKDRA